MTDIKQSYSPGTVYLRLGILAAGLFVVGTNAFVIAGVLPHIAQTLGVSPSAVSYSITFYALVVAVASPVVSITLARVSRTRLMAGGLVLISAGTALAALAPSLELFNAGRVVAALGGAALVPAATAAAPAMMPAAQRGRALAIAGLGFTLATAVGSPLGTALAGIGGWRLPLLVLAGLALVIAVLVAIMVRDVPIAPVTRLADRFAPLRNRAVLLALAATLLLMAGFNVVYIFSSAVTRSATAGSAPSLAGLLLVCGLGGVIGTALAGRITDRLGSRASAALTLGLVVIALVLLPLLQESYALTAVAFGVWGMAAFGAVVPIQHRLVSIDPRTAGLALSWYSTAMYLGISLAPIAGAAALPAGAQTIPLVGAVATALAALALQLGYRRRSMASAAASGS
jgi:predicted MFS family arabinose efflux permease